MSHTTGKENEDTKSIPAYVSPGTYTNFIESLSKTGIPGRIDKSLSFIAKKSNLVKGQLLSALEFLGLISEKGTPTARLKDVASLKGKELDAAKQEVLKNAYPFLFDGLSLANATTHQIAEQFKKQGVTAATMVFRCVAFFIAIAKDAGLEVSPHIKPSTLRPKTAKSETKKQQKPKSEKLPDKDRESEHENPPVGSPAGDGASTWEEMLLAKFPEFDPSWDDELKKKWFEGFEKLVKTKE